MSIKKIAIDLLTDTSKYTPLQKKHFYQACEDLMSGQSMAKHAQNLSDLDILQDVLDFANAFKKTAERPLPKNLLDFPLEERKKYAEEWIKKEGSNAPSLAKLYAASYNFDIGKANLHKIAKHLELKKYSAPEEEKEFYKIAAQAVEHVETKNDLVKLASLLETMDGALGVKKSTNPMQCILDNLELKKEASDKVIIESYTLEGGKVRKAYKEVMGEDLKESDDVETIVKSLPKPDRMVIAEKAKSI